MDEPLEGAEEVGLVGVRQTHHRDGDLRLHDTAHGGDARLEVLEEVGADVALLGDLVDADGGLGDHPERALGAGDELVEVRSGGRVGEGQGAPLAGGGDDPGADEPLVGAAVAVALLTGAAGGDPAAEGGELEALREVAEGEAAALQLGFEIRAVDAGLEGRGVADGIEVEELGHQGGVEGDHALLLLAVLGLHAADDARAAAEGHDGDAGVGAGLEHRLHFGLVARIDDGVGHRLAELAVAQPDQVRVAASHRVEGALVVVGLHPATIERLAQRVDEPLGQVALGQVHLCQGLGRRRGQLAQADGLADEVPDGGVLALQVEGLGAKPPPVPAKLLACVRHARWCNRRAPESRGDDRLVSFGRTAVTVARAGSRGESAGDRSIWPGAIWYKARAHPARAAPSAALSARNHGGIPRDLLPWAALRARTQRNR